MTITADLHVPGQSLLHRLDPRVKLWAALLGVALCILADRVAILAALIAAIHILLIASRIPLRRIAGLWRSLTVILLAILILQPLMTRGGTSIIWQIGPLTVTRLGLLAGLRIALRVAGAAFAVAIPLLTTPIDDLIHSLRQVGLPYNWALTVGLALRYLTTLGDLYTTISEAQQARGWDLAQRGTIKRVRAAVPTLIALIVASLRLSDALALGLAARGFGLPGPRTSLHQNHMRPRDWLAFSLVTAAFAAILLTAR